VARPLEHQVLHQVREPLQPVRIVRRPDAVPHDHRHVVEGVVGRQAHAQPVGEPVLLDGRPRRRSERGRSQRQRSAEATSAAEA
jgi:hypothetical protein